MLLRALFGLAVVATAAAMDIGVQRGQDHTFECDFPIASGLTYVVNWYKDGTDIMNYLSTEDEPTFTGDFEDRPGVQLAGSPRKDLVVQNLQIADAGEYHCSVTEIGAGAQSGDGTMYQLMVFDLPSVTISGGPYELGEGESMTTICRANSHPPSNFTWTLPNGDVSEGASLQIRNMTLADAGTYRCTADNGYGSAYETVQVTMTEKVIGGSDVMRVQGLPVMLLLLASLLLPVFLS